MIRVSCILDGLWGDDGESKNRNDRPLPHPQLAHCISHRLRLSCSANESVSCIVFCFEFMLVLSCKLFQLKEVNQNLPTKYSYVSCTPLSLNLDFSRESAITQRRENGFDMFLAKQGIRRQISLYLDLDASPNLALDCQGNTNPRLKMQASNASLSPFMLKQMVEMHLLVVLN